MQPRPRRSAAESFESFQQTNYFGGLDGLRCISILAVTAFHCEWRRFGFSRWGQDGVTLFFAISGFLITTLLLRELRDTGRISLARFYTRRSLRIFPLYYLVLAFYAAVAWRQTSPEMREFHANLKYFLTYTSNWFVRPGAHFSLAWSLATEEQFYLLWPPVLAFAPRRWVPIIVIATIAACVLAMRTFIVGSTELGASGDRIVTSMSPAICFGCILAFALSEKRSHRLLYLACGTSFGATIAVVAVLVCVTVAAIPAGWFELSAAWLVGVVVFSRGPILTALLANRPMRYIGVISYGMYLVNLISVNLMRRVAPHGGWRLVVLSSAFAILLSSISWFTFEAFFRSIKKRLTGRHRNVNRFDRSHAIDNDRGVALPVNATINQ